MTRGLWIDASSGAAGDMMLAALLDAGADRSAVESAFASLSSAAGETVSLHLQDVRRYGLRARLAVINAETSVTYRGLADVLQVLGAAHLPESVRRLAATVFQSLGAAESRVHGVPVSEIRFHEVGALDALADVVGCATALDSLGLLEQSAVITVSSVGVGSGLTRTAHGILPVPVPAVVQLLAEAGAPASAGPGDGELCTPTGAALLAAIATDWGPLPGMTLNASGYGAGSKDTTDHPNVVRVLVGEPVAARRRWQPATLRLVESTVDDLDPRLWPDALNALQAAGSIDAWLTPTIMRNGRPGHVVSALASPDTVESVVQALFCATTTLGVRVSDVQRLALPRDMVQVEVAGQPIRVKRGFVDDTPVTVQPEFADARAAALAVGLSTAEVIDAARELARGVSSEQQNT